MTTKYKIIGVAILAVLMFVGGYAFKASRVSSEIGGYSEREAENAKKIKANDAAVNQLEGQNKQLRENVAKLTADDEYLRTIIESRGGQIAAEVKNLENINEELKTDLAVSNAPGDKCARCQGVSARALARGQISKPFECKDECAGVNR